jgi:predicted Zn-dependent peptidase
MNLKDNFKIHTFRLASGLSLAVVPFSKSGVASVNFAYRVGSKDETPEIAGIAHLLEHLMFEGTHRVKKGDFDRICSTAGGTNNAYTTFDLTSYQMSLPSNQLELALWLESDRLYNSDITETALENQRKVVLEEIVQTVDNQPYSRWRDKTAELAFGTDQPYSWEVHGRKSAVASATLDQINNFRRAFYTPQNSCLVISGDVDPDRALALAEKYFSTKVEPAIYDRPAISERHSNCRGVQPDDVPMPAVFLSFHAPSFLDDEIHAADILSNILGSGKSSRLNKSLVYSKQAASYSGTFTDKRELGSLVSVYAFANEAESDTDSLCKLLTEELEKISNHGIERSEYEKSINQLTTQLAYELQYSAGLADVSANQLLFSDDPDRVYDLLDRYKKVTLDGVVDFARKYLQESSAIRVDVVSEENAD